MATRGSKNFEGFRLSNTFGTPYETNKDRAKREIMEHMPPLRTDDEVIVVDPEADMRALSDLYRGNSKE